MYPLAASNVGRAPVEDRGRPGEDTARELGLDRARLADHVEVAVTAVGDVEGAVGADRDPVRVEEVPRTDALAAEVGVEADRGGGRRDSGDGVLLDVAR